MEKTVIWRKMKNRKLFKQLAPKEIKTITLMISWNLDQSLRSANKSNQSRRLKESKRRKRRRYMQRKARKSSSFELINT